MEPSTEPGASPGSVESPQAQDHKHEMSESRAPMRRGEDGAPPLKDDATPTGAARADVLQPARKSQLQLGFKDRVLFYLMAGLLHAFSLIPDSLLYPLGIAGGFIGYCLDR